MTQTITNLLAEFGDAPYTREQHTKDLARVFARLCEKHNATTHAELHEIIREHRYEHTPEDPEDEYIGLVAFARSAGWT